MNAVAVENVPRGNQVDTFGGLRREGETIAQALTRLERRRNYAKVIGTDEGQRLLAAAAKANADARRQVGAPPKRQAPLDPIEEARALAGLPLADPLVCVGSNHVPGHSEGCPKVREIALAVNPDAVHAIEAAGKAAGPRLIALPLDLVDIGENVRADAGDLEGLAASLVAEGIQQPIRAVGPGPDGRYRAINGQRRILASRLAKLTTIDAVVEASSAVDKPGAKRSIAQLAENLIRKDMNPIEEALALRAVLDDDKTLTQVELGRRLGRSEPWMASTLALLRAPAAVQDFVRTEALSIAHAKALAGLPADDQVRLAKSAVANGVSAHSLEQTAKYERQDLTAREASKKRQEDAGKRAIAALEAAGTPKTARLYVVAEDYRIRDDEVRKVVKAAGYKVEDGWARTGDRWAKCNCTALMLRIRDGKGSTIEAVCVSEAHRRELDKEQNAVRTAKEAVAAADRKALAKAVRDAMPKDLHPTIGRLILKVLDGYYGKSWSEYSKISDVAKAIADKLTDDASLRGSGYNGDAKAVPIKTLLKELGAEQATAAAVTGKHPRRRPPTEISTATEPVDPAAAAATVLAEGNA